MPSWLIFAALGAIAVTALLTWLLWRINGPLLARRDEPDGGADDGGSD